MVQLQILTGNMAGTRWVARHFPVCIGRVPANDLQLEDAGVWDLHLDLTLDRSAGFMLTARPGALVTVNDERVQTTRLCNGDSITIGSVQLRFSLSETRQRGLRLREWFVWLLIVLISLGEVALVYWLLR